MSSTIVILSNSAITSNGSFLANIDIDQEIILFWNIIGSITGSSPTIQFSMQEIDPSDQLTPNGGSSISGVMSTTGVGNLKLQSVISNKVLVSWTVTGSGANFSNVSLFAISKDIANTITISGSIDQGVPNTTANSWPIEITDGTNVASVKAASTAAIATDKALVVAISPNNSITASNPSVGINGAAISSSSTQIGGSDGTNLQVARVFDADTGAGTQYVIGVGLRKSASGGSVDFGTSSDPIRTDPTGTTTQPISGTVTANAGSGTFTVSGTVTANQGGTWTVQPGNTANTTPWLATINQGGNSATVTASSALKVDGSAVTQPVSGTVTANIGTSGSLALDTSVTGLQVSQSSTTSGQKGGLILGAVTTAAPSYTTAQSSPLSLTTAGNLRVDGSSVTQPVSGTVTANQGGTWTVQPGNTANTTPWLATINQGGNSATVTASNALKIDGSAVTQPVSGTITANAGSGTFTVSGTVTSNIGTTNGLALDATVAKLTVAQGAVLGSNTQALAGGSVTTAAPTYTTGNINPLSLNTAGGLRVDGSGVTQPVSGTVTANAGSGTFAVSGTVTSNIGTTNGLALDTSVNGILVSQGSTTSGEKGPLIQGAVTTSAPSYVTAQTSPLSLTTAGNLRVDGSSVTQPVSGTVTSNIGTTNGLALDATLTGGTQQSKITDGTNIATVKAASTVPVVADKALVVSVSPNSIAAIDRAAVTVGTQQGVMQMGLDGITTSRMVRIGEYGSQRSTSEILLWHDAFEGSTVNAFWTQSTTTMTIAQATGVLTLNNSNITTVNTDAIITSVRQFPKFPRNPLYARFRANITANAASNHTLVEMGFGAPSGVTAVINNGAFFRWRVDGTLAAVVSYNGTEKVTQVLAQGVISTTNYYYYDIIIDDDYARFIVSDAAGSPVVDTQVSLTLTFPFTLAVSHIPSFARVYVDATGAGTAIQCKIAAHTVQMLDGQMPKPWEHQLASCMRQASINPTTYAQTTTLANGAAPSTQTPSNTASAYTTLGGEYACAATAASENILSVFGFTVPSPYTFYLRGLFIPLPAVTGAAIATIPLIEWFIAPNASSTNLSSATGLQRIPLPGLMNTISAAPISSLFQGSAITWSPGVPIICLPGTVLHIGYKVIAGAATASLVYRGTIYVDGFFE